MVRQHRDLPFKQRRVDALSAPRLMARFDRKQNADDAEHAGAKVGYRDTRLDRSTSFLPGDAHAAGESLHENIICPSLRARPIRAEAADGAIDKTRVDGSQRFITQAQLFKGPDAEIIDQDVGRSSEFLQYCHAVVVLEVDGKAA